MTNTQKKVLELSSKTLGGFDTYPIYRAVVSVLDKSKITADDTKEILRIVQEESRKMKQIVSEAKDWIDTVLTDLT